MKKNILILMLLIDGNIEILEKLEEWELSLRQSKMLGNLDLISL